MKRIATWFVPMMIIGVILGCASDIIIESPPSLKGAYTGQYTIKNLETQVTQRQAITWLFTDITYNLRWDSASGNSTDFCICNTSGQYSLEDRVFLKQASWTPASGLCDACSDDLTSPKGFFALERPGDTIKLIQVEDDVQKEIKLVRVEEPEE